MRMLRRYWNDSRSLSEHPAGVFVLHTDACDALQERQARIDELSGTLTELLPLVRLALLREEVPPAEAGNVLDKIAGVLKRAHPAASNQDGETDARLLGHQLAKEAFEFLGRDSFTVHAVLSPDRPETITAYHELRQLLVAAYQAGARDRQTALLPERLTEDLGEIEVAAPAAPKDAVVLDWLERRKQRRLTAAARDGKDGQESQEGAAPPVAAAAPMNPEGVASMTTSAEPPAHPPVRPYRVSPNACRCHPETCCCDDYAILTPHGKRHSTYMSLAVAEQVCDALNLSLNQQAYIHALEQALVEVGNYPIEGFAGAALRRIVDRLLGDGRDNPAPPPGEILAALMAEAREQGCHQALEGGLEARALAHAARWMERFIPPDTPMKEALEHLQREAHLLHRQTSQAEEGTPAWRAAMDQIGRLMVKAGTPLSAAQGDLLAGALAVWLTPSTQQVLDFPPPVTPAPARPRP